MRAKAAFYAVLATILQIDQVESTMLFTANESILPLFTRINKQRERLDLILIDFLLTQCTHVSVRLWCTGFIYVKKHSLVQCYLILCSFATVYSFTFSVLLLYTCILYHNLQYWAEHHKCASCVYKWVRKYSIYPDGALNSRLSCVL